MKSHDISMKFPRNHIKFHESQHSQRISTSFFGQKKKQPAVAGGPCLLGRHGLIGRGPRKSDPPASMARKAFFSILGGKWRGKVLKTTGNLWKMSWKCPDIIRYLLISQIYLRYFMFGTIREMNSEILQWRDSVGCGFGGDFGDDWISGYQKGWEISTNKKGPFVAWDLVKVQGEDVKTRLRATSTESGWWFSTPWVPPEHPC